MNDVSNRRYVVDYVLFWFAAANNAVIILISIHLRSDRDCPGPVTCEHECSVC